MEACGLIRRSRVGTRGGETLRLRTDTCRWILMRQGKGGQFGSASSGTCNGRGSLVRIKLSDPSTFTYHVASLPLLNKPL